MSSSNQPVPGYLYILSNPSMPGILKIGMSSRSGHLRAEEIYKGATGVPTPFKMEFEVYSTDIHLAEGLAHESLQHLRISESREFFRVPLSMAIQAVCNAALDKYEDLHVSDSSNYFDPGCASIIAYLAGISWKEVTHAFIGMRPEEVRGFYKRSLENHFDVCRYVYGDKSNLTRLAENKLTDFVERFDQEEVAILSSGDGHASDPHG